MIAETARYFTTINPDVCSCQDWEYRGMRLGRACKHIVALQAAVALLDANAAKWATVGKTSSNDEVS